MTIASSTTSPIASTSASRVSVLIEKPNSYMTLKAPISDTGMVTIGISVARSERRKRKITSTTSTIASTMVWNTLSIEACDEDRAVVADVDLHALRQTWRRSAAASSRTASETSSGLAVDCLTTPSATARVALEAGDGALVERRRSRLRRRRASRTR